MKHAFAVNEINSDACARIDHDARLLECVKRGGRIEQAIDSRLCSWSKAHADWNRHVFRYEINLARELIAQRTHKRGCDGRIDASDEHRGVHFSTDHFVEFHREFDRARDIVLRNERDFARLFLTKDRELDARVANLNCENGWLMRVRHDGALGWIQRKVFEQRCVTRSHHASRKTARA